MSSCLNFYSFLLYLFSRFSAPLPTHAPEDVQDLTASATEIARSDAVRGPALSTIHDVLHKHNVRVPSSKTVDMNRAENVREAKEWLNEQADVVILHHDFVAAPRISRRATSEYTNSTGLTEEEINDYQVREE